MHHASLPGAEVVDDPFITAGVTSGGKGPRVEQQARGDYHGTFDGELDVGGQAQTGVRGEGHDEAKEEAKPHEAGTVAEEGEREVEEGPWLGGWDVTAGGAIVGCLRGGLS